MQGRFMGEALSHGCMAAGHQYVTAARKCISASQLEPCDFSIFVAMGYCRVIALFNSGCHGLTVSAVRPWDGSRPYSSSTTMLRTP